MLPGAVSLQSMRIDLEGRGYCAREFTLSGLARTLGSKLTAGDGAAFCTRVIVFGPRDPARFSGTAVVEWLNCRQGIDTIPQWLRLQRHIVREGMAWVGVSAQRAGVEAGVPGNVAGHLKAQDPVRYHALHHPGDAFSYDMFHQAALALRRGELVLPPPACVLGVGSSQSARYLSRYVEAVDPLRPAFDGFLLTGRHQSAATPAGESIGEERVPVRDDVDVPVLVVQSETDVFGRMQSFEVRQADTPRFRMWEVATAAHADAYVTRVGTIDDGTVDAAALSDAYVVMPSQRLPLAVRMNASPASHYVHHAALQHLEAWARSGAAPPTASLLGGDPRLGIARDRLGIALGGVRTPWADCPAEIHSGDNGERDEFAALFGSTRPLPPGTLSELYPGGPGDYLDRFAAALGKAIGAGFLLEADAAEILALASVQFAALVVPTH